MEKNWRGKPVAEDTPEQVLREVYGFDEFRGSQADIINRIRGGGDALWIAPTGIGKSLCFQLPAVMAEKGRMSLVVSPLIALMRDQVRMLKSHKVTAADIHHQSQRDTDKLHKDIRDGKYNVLYTSPEQLTKPELVEAIADARVNIMAVDEGHCISQWGHDFRPSYARLGDVRDAISPRSVAAFTATASPTVEEDIRNVLRLSDADVTRDEPLRQNLDYGVTEVDGMVPKVERVAELIETYAPNPEDGVIVYSGTRDGTERVARLLRKTHKIESESYHGKMGARDRKKIEKNFLDGDTRVLVATNAFGMGIHKPNIRLIAHLHFPGSVQSYLQETGRAGRDGLPSHCHLLYDANDVGLQEYFIERKTPKKLLIRGVYRVLERLSDGHSVYWQDGFFHVDLFKFYRNFDQKTFKFGQLDIDTRELEVNAALSILEQIGAIERRGMTMFKLNGFSEETFEIAGQVREIRDTVNRGCLGQMIDYAESPASSQQMLIELLNTDMRNGAAA